MFSPCVHGLPFQDLMPGLLVVLVVDVNDVGHVLRIEVIVTPAPPAASELLIIQPHRQSVVTAQFNAIQSVRTNPFRSMAFQNICSDG